MSESLFRRYLVSCGLLIVPIMLWNAVFTRFLPRPLSSAEFWRDIPPLIGHGENVLRVVVIAMPFLMPLDLSTADGRRGLARFALAVSLYFLAWLPLMTSPGSAWSTSAVGVLAPAYTPILWLTALGLLGRRLFWRVPYRRWIYLAVAAGFVGVHVAHTYIVYARNY